VTIGSSTYSEASTYDAWGRHAGAAGIIMAKPLTRARVAAAFCVALLSFDHGVVRSFDAPERRPLTGRGDAMKYCLVGLLLFFQSCVGATPSERAKEYFGEAAAVSRPEHVVLLDQYAKAFALMRQPSMAAECRTGRAEQYRFLYYSSAPEETFFVHVMQRAVSSGSLNASVSAVQKKSVKSVEWTNLIDKLAEIKFVGLPTWSDSSGVDGANFVFEGCKEGKYHLVDRWMPEDERLISLGEAFARLGGMPATLHPIVAKP
jgi:hypothetical protein